MAHGHVAVQKAMWHRHVAPRLEYHIARWAADTCAYGSYSYIPVGAVPDDRATLARAEGALLFAGEHSYLAYMTACHMTKMDGG